MNARLFSTLTVVAAAAVSPLAAQSPCPDNFTGYGQLAAGKSITCTCAAERTGTGSVWGSDRYTADSSVCRAALHAGKIKATGGKVTVYAFGRCEQFTGTTRHGVATADWGGYDHTFAFAKEIRCAGEAPAGGPPACPQNAVGLREQPPASGHQCHCGSAAMHGALWGTDLYTLDSSVCAAARHAGAVPAAGGDVTIFIGGRCGSFEASTRNGVDSGSWGPYDNTFGFAYPLPNCADGTPPAR